MFSLYNNGFHFIMTQEFVQLFLKIKKKYSIFIFITKSDESKMISNYQRGTGNYKTFKNKLQL